jgi:hypothetical protein
MTKLTNEQKEFATKTAVSIALNEEHFPSKTMERFMI